MNVLVTSTAGGSKIISEDGFDAEDGCGLSCNLYRFHVLVAPFVKSILRIPCRKHGELCIASELKDVLSVM